MAHPRSVTAAASKRRRCLMPQPWKHPQSGMYYLRLRVPDALRPILGREYKRSLKTKNPAEAKARYPQQLMAAQHAFARAKQQAAGKELLTDRDIEQLAARWYRDEVAKMEEQGSFRDWLVADSVDVEEGATVRSVPVFTSVRDFVEEDDDFSLPKLLSRVIEQGLRDNAIPKPPVNSAASLKLQAAFREHLYKLSDLAYERLQGNWAVSQNVVEPQPLTLEREPDARAQGTRLLALFDKYAEDKQLNDGDTRTVRKTMAAYRNIVEQFVELCGDVPVERITRETVRDYRALLVQLPAKGEGTRKLAATQLIAKAVAEGLPRLTAATVRNKLLALSAIFSYGVRMGKLAENPVQASGIGKAAKRAASAEALRVRRRKDYTRDEINSIFSSPIYEAGGTAPKADFGRAWYWMPLLLYYTGARREELAQLMVRDVKFCVGPKSISSISILASEDEDEGRGVKTEGSRRVIPLHDDLMTRGFAEYVDSLPQEGQLFPKLIPNRQGFYGAYFGKRWGAYVRDVVGIAYVHPSHGFRHTFKTLCREVGIPEEVHDAITGHAGQGRGGRGYGEMPPERMAEELAKYPLAVERGSELQSHIQSL